MRNVRSLRGAVRRYSTLAVVAIALTAAMGMTAAALAQSRQADTPGGASPQPSGRAVLAEDVTKLAIVVMANQTPITQADAKAVLPILEKLQPRGGPESAGLDEKTAADLDAQLRAALSPTLCAAVDAVRLLTPAGPPERGGQLRRDGGGRGGPGGRDGRGPGGGRGGGGRGHGMGGPGGPGGPHGRGGGGPDGMPGPGMGGGGGGGHGPGGGMGPMGPGLLGPLVSFLKGAAG